MNRKGVPRLHFKSSKPKRKGMNDRGMQLPVLCCPLVSLHVPMICIAKDATTETPDMVDTVDTGQISASNLRDVMTLNP